MTTIYVVCWQWAGDSENDWVIVKAFKNQDAAINFIALNHSPSVRYKLEEVQYDDETL